MMAVGEAFDEDTLPKNHRRGLADAIDVLIDEFFGDLRTIDNAPQGRAHEVFRHTFMSAHLPEQYILSYTPLFCRQFVVCVVTVAWKLAQPQWLPLSCLAEELALRALITGAASIMEMAGEEADFGDFEDAAFEDLDHEYLFRPALDGIDRSPVGARLGMGSLHPKGWFEPFGEGSRGAVHPYVAPDEEQSASQ